MCEPRKVPRHREGGFTRRKWMLISKRMSGSRRQTCPAPPKTVTAIVSKVDKGTRTRAGTCTLSWAPYRKWGRVGPYSKGIIRSWKIRPSRAGEPRRRWAD